MSDHRGFRLHGDRCHGNVPGCRIEQLQATCSVVGPFDEQCTCGVTMHDARSA
jgi:hypothetical protein